MDDGKTISWSQKYYSKEYATFQLPCGNCLQCRLEYARQWATRCMHEALMHEDNCFITLTYNDKSLKRCCPDGKLQYRDFQKFLKRLRRKFPNREIGFFSTGEYGDRTKRPHWHAIIFNWCPSDLKYHRSNDRGDRVYTSQELDKLWLRGFCEVGSVTFDSAGYVARYAAKGWKAHQEASKGEFKCISKKSMKHAIGKRYVEKYWQQMFRLGFCYGKHGQKMAIPRYYEKWMQKHHWEEYLCYVESIKNVGIREAELKKDVEIKEYFAEVDQRVNRGCLLPLMTRQECKRILLEERFKILQSKRKGDM